MPCDGPLMQLPSCASHMRTVLSAAERRDKEWYLQPTWMIEYLLKHSHCYGEVLTGAGQPLSVGAELDGGDATGVT